MTSAIPIEIESLLTQPRYKDPIRIYWELNRRCNYDCTECPSYIHDNHSSFPKIEDYEKVIENLLPQLKNKDFGLWAFSGGEPTINPSLKYIIETLGISEIPTNYLELCTNLSLPINSLIHIFDLVEKYFSDGGLVVASYHYQFCKPDVFYEKIRIISEKYRNIKIYPVILLPPNQNDFESAIDLFNRLKNCSNPDLRPIRKGLGKSYIDYKADQLKTIEEYFVSNKSARKPSLKIKYSNGLEKLINSPPELIFTKENYFKNWLCEAGKSELMIDPEFDLFRASCGKGFEAHKLGSLLKNDFTVLTEPAPCLKESCFCITDICINKKAKLND
jgi:hypothetical protein